MKFNIFTTVKVLLFCILFYACSNNKVGENDYDITFLKSQGSYYEGTCNVFIKLADNSSLLVDTFKCSSQTTDTVLYKDISKLPNFVFGLIDALPIPNGYGILLKKYALAKDYVINNRGETYITFYRYYLFNSNETVILIKEKWQNAGQNGIDMISNECLYPIVKPLTSVSEKEKNGIHTKKMIFKWCECNDGCMSSFIDENGKEYDFGNPSNEKFEFDCEMYPQDENVKKDTKIGKQFDIQYEISESGIRLISINETQMNNATKENDKAMGSGAKDNKTEEKISNSNQGYYIIENNFEGQQIKEGERVIKLTWDNQKQTALWNVMRNGTLNNTLGMKIYRHCSDLVTVPVGKKWIVLYGIITTKSNTNGYTETVYGPEIKIDNGRTLEPCYLELPDKGISFSEAKDKKLKIYAGSTIRGFIPPDYEFKDNATAEVYFIEVND